METGFDMLRVEIDDDALHATIDRPPRHNTIDDRVLGELEAMLELAARTPSCRVVVLRGRDGVFSTGMDLAEASGEPSLTREGGERFFGLLDGLARAPHLVVAVVDGRAVGGGVGLAAASDIVVATPRSSFSLPEALWGLLPCVVLPYLSRRTGAQAARAMALTTLPVDGRRGHELGLVDVVTDDPDREVARLRRRLALIDRRTIGDAKHYLDGLDGVTDDARSRATAGFTRQMTSAVAQERMASYVRHNRYPWEPG